MHQSADGPALVSTFAARIHRATPETPDRWCIFDKTATGAAASNAVARSDALARRPRQLARRYASPRPAQPGRWKPFRARVSPLIHVKDQQGGLFTFVTETKQRPKEVHPGFAKHMSQRNNAQNDTLKPK
jgi:hypothetical protein